MSLVFIIELKSIFHKEGFGISDFGSSWGEVLSYDSPKPILYWASTP